MVHGLSTGVVTSGQQNPPTDLGALWLVTAAGPHHTLATMSCKTQPHDCRAQEGTQKMPTTRFGDHDVPILDRSWPCSAPLPYRKTYKLKPGDRWENAPTTEGQLEHYVELDGEVMPVGAAIARELVREGASWAYFTELWGGLTLVGPDLICMPYEGRAATLFDQLRQEHGGRLGGLPDVIGEHPDGRIFMREAKTPKSHDRLRSNQHAFARMAQRVLGEQLDLAVVLWTPQTEPR